MPATAIELQSSRQYNHNKGKPTATREYIVIDADSEADVLALFGGTLPDQNELYPNTGAFLYDLIARDYSIQKVPEHPRAFRISYTYEPQGNNVPPYANPFSTGKEPGEVGYRTAQASTKAEFFDLWRSVPYATLRLYESSGSMASDTDVGGDPLDQRGVPVSSFEVKQEISITVVDRELPNPDAIKTALGSRNAGQFLGYEDGSVLFTGFDGSIQPETGNTQASFKFLFSSFFHLVQVPQRTSLGDVVTSTDAGTYYGKAFKVYVEQPFRFAFDFNSLSPYFSGL